MQLQLLQPPLKAKAGKGLVVKRRVGKASVAAAAEAGVAAWAEA
jgi:hypothetical protein